AEEALRNSEALYHSLVESLPLAIYRKDPEGRVTFGNRRLGEYLGRPLGQILGKTGADFYPPELAEQHRLDQAHVLATGEILEEVEEHVGPDREKSYLQVVKAPVRDFRGVAVGTQGLVWDVTARKRGEEELKRLAAELARSNEDLQQFA